jgi:hypothetical protein
MGYILLALFIAGHNPPPSDVYVFTMKKRGRRKKRFRGDASEVRVVKLKLFVVTFVWLCKQADCTGDRVFPLERVYTIFMSLVTQEKCLDVALSLGGTPYVIAQVDFLGVKLASACS